MKDNNRYFLYARKSTDTEDKQVQSLPDQINAMNKKAEELWIDIIEIFQESMSAKKPWRFRFNEMVERIKAGEANGIIAWKLDRLTRNPVDTWTIQYMLQDWVLNKIITNDREYNPVDAWLLFSVETWMSNQFIMDLRKNVIRWMDSKIEKWVYAWRVPEGYINVKGKKIIDIDANNFLLVRKMWDLMLTGNYSVWKIKKIAHDEWGYRRTEERIRKNESEKISLSWMYKIFTNPFYTWNFIWKWELKKGTHKPMITFKEYERVQKLLWKKWRTIRSKSREFSYTGIISCWECWWMITAIEKNKRIVSTWEIKSYVYYKCTKRRKWISCNQKAVTLKSVEKQISSILDKIELVPEFKEWWLKLLRRDYKTQIEQNKKIQASIRKKISENENKLHRLTDLLLDEAIDRKEYNIRKEWLKIELIQLDEQLLDVNSDKDKSIDLTEKLFDIIIWVQNKFNQWSLREKKTIFSLFGENYVLKDWILAIELHPWLKPIENKLPEIKRKYSRLEPNKKGISFLKTNTSNDVILLWYSWDVSREELIELLDEVDRLD